MTSVEGLSAYFNTRQAGDNVSLSVLRNGQSLNVQVTLAAWPDRISSSVAPQPVPSPGVPGPWGGRSRQP